MNTPPADLPLSALRAAVTAGWSLDVESLTYRAVGFGSHHWELSDRSGDRWFVTVDDLRTRRSSRGEPLTACFDRLRAALTAAQALRASGREFVVSPVPQAAGSPPAADGSLPGAAGGSVLAAVGEFFAVAVYPFVAGESFTWGEFTGPHRDAVLDLLVAVHAAPPSVCGLARPDDYAVPFRDIIDAAGAGDPALGPYSVPAGSLLAAHAAGVRRELARYDELVAAVRADPPRMVLTHGEPHPGNTMRTATGGWLLIDWDTTLLAPPERDLWDLEAGHEAYTAATGTVLRPEVLELYRLRWDLAEIAVYLARFTEPHGRTTDDRESWANLEEAVTRVAA